MSFFLSGTFAFLGDFSRVILLMCYEPHFAFYSTAKSPYNVVRVTLPNALTLSEITFWHSIEYKRRRTYKCVHFSLHILALAREKIFLFHPPESALFSVRTLRNIHK